MNETLEKKIKIELYFSIAIFLLGIMSVIISLVFVLHFLKWFEANKLPNGKLPKDIKIKLSDISGGKILMVSWWIVSISNLVIWILGIINAIQINRITHNSTLLIVFAIFPLWFVYLIFALLEKRKIKHSNNIELP